ncbi:MAG: GyrI-like domain-containing protein [Chloroflexia bacterium]
MSSATTKKMDLKKGLAQLYNPSAKEVTEIDVPPMRFLMIDGAGDPNNAPEYQEAVEALYSLAYALKFMLKKEQGVNYSVMPLEGLWWATDMSEFSVERKGDWQWTMMIMQPQEVDAALFEQALEQARGKKSSPALAKLRLELFDEGHAAQIMHLGPYSAEGPTVARLHNFIAERGYTLDGLRGKHHEVYLSDPRRSSAEKMKTIIRQPLTK